MPINLELRECPWCGAHDKRFLHNHHAQSTVSYHHRDHYYIQCLNCHAQGPAGNTAAEAVELWHTLKRGKEKSYLQEFIQVAHFVLELLDDELYDFNVHILEPRTSPSKTPEITKLLETYYTLEEKLWDNLPDRSKAEEDAQTTRRWLCYLIDQRFSGEFSDQYPTFPQTWEQHLPRTPELLELLQQAALKLSMNNQQSLLTTQIDEVLDKYENARKKIKNKTL
ncbi:Lar family restriction alleviation protein [Maridesulfovibrio ferrireducens]|uniref:Lar family restriction alleviation protein n=1 Tax=Maridesulfovibrio ferrireducens TaxID=246191 RepID=UPI001A1A857E|nr:Lar family restriction alleviation protein [Maridesulfovibrio ferrireducens]MBI9112363.1 Lar family restriction alleviation protein [Maridesulfovibrio ferrireducens]